MPALALFKQLVFGAPDPCGILFSVADPNLHHFEDSDQHKHLDPDHLLDFLQNLYITDKLVKKAWPPKNLFSDDLACQIRQVGYLMYGSN